MNPAGDLERRLNTWITSGFPCWSMPIGTALVEETADDGYAHVTFELPPGRRCLQWRIEASHLFPILREEQACDGVIMVEALDGTWEVHVIECKKTVGDKALTRARAQMRWSLARVRAICGILGLQLSRAVCYTAFREEHRPTATSTRPTDFKIAVGPAGSSRATNPRLLDLNRQWNEGRFKLEDLGGELEHYRLELDKATGVGRFSLKTS